jgi:hypothetical protein
MSFRMVGRRTDAPRPGRVHRQQRALREVHALAPGPFLVKVDREAAPEAPLMEVDRREEIGLAGIFPIVRARALGGALVELRHPDVGIDADVAKRLLGSVRTVQQLGLRPERA